MTVQKGDKNFAKYLDGSFSTEHRALPMNSYNINTQSERVTFRILPVNSISRPGWLKLVAEVMRLEWLPLSLMPLLSCLVYLVVMGIRINGLKALACSVSVTLLHISAFLFNDYYDYIKGVDRISDRGGNPAIVHGWASPKQIWRGALYAFLAGVLCGAPVLLGHPKVLMVTGLGALLGVLGYSIKGRGIKERGLGELLVFICLGPLMVWGVSVATADHFDKGLLAMGIVYGFLAAFFLTCRQLENLIFDDRAGNKTLVQRLGFDRAVKYIFWQVGSLFVMQSFLLIYLTPRYSWKVAIALVGCGVLAWQWRSFLRVALSIRSPLSSRLVLFHLRAARCHATFGIVLMATMLLVL